MVPLEEQLKQRIDDGDMDLPVLPRVSAEVMALTRSENSDARELSQLIQNDQSLAGHVMRLANSAAYNGQGKIQTLQQAITKLGLRQVGQMALTVSVGQSVFKSSVATEQMMGALWQHALATGAWSKEIARICRSNTEIAFLCGLLHQIGKPVAINTLVQLIPDDDALENQSDRLMLVEKYYRGIGVNLSQKWDLPEAVVDTIKYVDHCDGDSGAKQEVMIVNAAAKLATQTLQAEDTEWLQSTVAEHSIFQALNLYEEEVDILSEKLESIKELMNTLTL